MNLFDVQTPFFNPLYRRILVTVLPGLWGLFELSLGNTVWAVLFLGATAYLVHQFFIVWTPQVPKDDQND